MEGDKGEATDLDPIDRLGTLTQTWAHDGLIGADVLARLIDEVDLPARRYREAVDALWVAGIRIADDRVDEETDDLGPPVDGFGAFIRRTQHPILSAAQEQALGRRMERGRLAVRAIEERSETDAGALAQFRRWAQDGKAAENDLVAHNQRLVMSIARLFSSFESPGLDHEDLIQEGWAGLAHAVEKWDYRRGLKFSTYGTWWIRQAMSRAVADRGSTIRLPVHSREALNAILRAEAVLLAQGKRPSNRALSKVTSLSEARVKELLSWRNRMSSLDRMIELGVPLVELDRSEESPEHFAEIAVLVDQVSELVGSLSERDADVIRRRFGLEGRPVETLDQIGKRRGVTRERIRQIEERALRQLRSQAEALHDFTAED